MPALRRFPIGALALAVCAPIPADALATRQVDVGVVTNRFAPRTLDVSLGDSVFWSRLTPGAPHNVREDARIFRGANMLSKEPSYGPIDFAVRFSAGTFHYYCEVHGGPSGGMDGLIRVPVTIKDAPSGPRFRVRWAAGGAQTGTRWDVRYRVGGSKWRLWRARTTSRVAVFGAGKDPVRVREGKRYRFRARAVGSEGASRWSPQVSYRP
jgi:plastocyanin